MADCVSCGTRLEDGITRCPQCKANLARPGGLLQIGGWVLFFTATIPIVVGVLAAEQNNYIPLGIGIAILIGGAAMIFVGRARTAGSPATTRPTAAAPPPPPPPGAAPAAR